MSRARLFPAAFATLSLVACLCASPSRGEAVEYGWGKWIDCHNSRIWIPCSDCPPEESSSTGDVIVCPRLPWFPLASSTIGGQTHVDVPGCEYHHDADDYQVAMPTDGCEPCGATGARTPGTMPALWLKRHHRTRHFLPGAAGDRPTTFGPGVYSNFDRSLEFTTNPSGSTYIHIFDPLQREAIETRDSNSGGGYNAVIDGIYHDQAHHAIREIRTYNGAGALAAPQDQVVRAVLLHHNGTREHYETVQTGVVNNTGGIFTTWGRLTRIEDRNGNAITISYKFPRTASDATLGGSRAKLWQMHQITDPYARVMTATYRATQVKGTWAVSSIALPTGTSIAYEYDEIVGLKKVTHPDGRISTFAKAYDATMDQAIYTFDDPAAVGRARKTTVRVSPDTEEWKGLVHSVKGGDGQYLYFAEDLAIDPTTIDPSLSVANSKVMHVYMGDNTLYRLVTHIWEKPQRIDVATNFTLGGATTGLTYQQVAAYDMSGGFITRTTRVVDPADPAKNLVTTYAYTTGRPGVTKRTYPDLTFESATYNDLMQPLQVTDRLNRTTTYEYSSDGKGNLVKRTDAVGTAAQAVWTWTYNSRGQVLEARDPLYVASAPTLHATTYVYDGAGYLTNVLEPADTTTGARPVRQLSFHATTGRLLEVTDAGGRRVRYSYDARNRVTKIEYGVNVTTADFEEFFYDINPVSGLAEAKYGGLLTRHIDRNRTLTRYDYDTQGRRTSTTVLGTVGAANAATVYGTTTVTYRPGTTLEATRVNDGERTVSTYDVRQRRTTIARNATATKVLTESLGYDGADRVISHTDPYQRRTFQVYHPKNNWVVRTIRELIPGGVPAGTALATVARPTAANPPFVIEDRTYDNAGQLLTVVDGRGITSRYEYDAQGRQTAMIQASAVPSGLTALSYRMEFRYDAAGNRTHVVHPRTGQAGETGSFITRSTYSGRNLRLSEIEADGRSGESATRSWTYTLTGKPATAKDFRGKTTSFTYYPCCDRLHQVTAPGGFVTTTLYDKHGNVTGVQDPNGNTTSRSYDPRHRLTSVTNAENEVTTYTYDDTATDGTGLSATYATTVSGLGLGTNANGQIVEVKNHLGETEVEIRDGLGRSLRRRDGNGNATTMAYDTVISSLVETRVTDAGGHVVRSCADGAGRVREQYDAESRKTTQTFDANGNRLTVRDPNNVGLTCVYDAADRDTQCTDTAGAVTRRTYNAHGSVLTETDALLQVTSHVHDGRERKTRTTDRIAGVTTFAYDANRNLTKITDAELRVTDYVYDDRNLLVAEHYPPSEALPGLDAQGRSFNKRTYQYDAGARLTMRTDQSGTTTQYGYDKANRLLTRQYPDGLHDTFAYDDASRLTQATSGRFATTVTRSYTLSGEKGGRLRSETQTVGGYAFTVGYGYDADNQVTTITYPNGQVAKRVYTARHQLKEVHYDNGTVTTPNIASRAYDYGGRLLTTTYANTTVETRTYKTDNTVASIVVPGVTNFSYTYDANRRKTYEGHQFASDIQEFVGYDHENRLTSWKRDGVETQSWTLSKVGDWSATTRNGTTQTRTHSPVHETLTTTTGGVTSTLDYDAQGNLTLDQQGQRYGWDVENRLAASRAGAASSGYVYDALGRRLGKTALGVTTTFVHDGAQVIAEYEAPALQSSTIGAPALAGAFSDNGQGTITQSAGGTDIWGTADQFRYAYATMTGNGSITARVVSQTNTDPSAKAGVMVRESLAANARHASLLAMPKGSLAFQRRAATGGSTVNTGIASVTVPVWLRLTRSGATITAERSVDGVTWTTAGSDATAIPAASATVYIGLAVTSHNAAATSTVTFTNVSTTGNVRTTTSPAYARGYVYGSYVDELLAILPASGLAADRKIVHSNHLYSVAALTSSTGAVLERYRYDAYGQRTVLAADAIAVRASSAQGNQYGFTGRYLDKETGLWYFRARYYSGSLGTFVSRDPWRFSGIQAHARDGYPDGLNGYAAYFVPSQTDPSGMNRRLMFQGHFWINVDVWSDDCCEIIGTRNLDFAPVPGESDFVVGGIEPLGAYEPGTGGRPLNIQPAYPGVPQLILSEVESSCKADKALVDAWAYISGNPGAPSWGPLNNCAVQSLNLLHFGINEGDSSSQECCNTPTSSGGSPKERQAADDFIKKLPPEQPLSPSDLGAILGLYP